MSLSTRPLSYCTNVHPGRSVDEVERGLDDYTLRVRQRYGHPMAAGLWLAQPVVRELREAPGRLKQFEKELARRGLVCYTLNAFPYGDFHSERVKQKVYVPDWSEPRRLDYTWDCARVLAELLPEGDEGSLSTVPLGFRLFDHPLDFDARCVTQLVELAKRLDRLRGETGRLVRLAIEPEPLCLLERTDETIAFFGRLRQQAAEENQTQIVDRYLGVCFDVCHQAVEFEDVARSVAAYEQAGVRINKVHITCALQLDRPVTNHAAREALARYVEPRYLHQTFARTLAGEILKAEDLTEDLALHPDPDFLEAGQWRIHFHVPVNAETIGPLKTTRDDLKQALSAVARLDYSPHLEVETYTWEVLPDGRKSDLVDGLTAEMTATHELLDDLRRAV